tara:strand:+ start:243 stop:1463 length:1221 start_codon:yes stop_codon:yes gene_type:complete
MSEENNDSTTVQKVDIDIDALLGTAADAIMVPEESTESGNKNVLSNMTPDTSFLDKPVAGKVEADNSKSVTKESVTDEQVFNEIIDETPNQAKPKSSGSMVEAAKNLIEKNILLPFDEDKALEDYTASDMEELIEANFNQVQSNLSKELPQHFFKSMPPEMQHAYDYIENGGTDLKGLFSALSQTHEMYELDVTKESDQVQAIRSYLQATSYGNAEEIQDEINSLTDRGDLEKKAKQFKPKLDAMQQNIVNQKLAAQEEASKQRQEQSQHYMDNVYNTLEKGELNGLTLDNKVQNMLYSGLVQPSYPSINGKQTNLLGHLLEKYQWVEPRHDLIAEALYLLADPEGYRSQLSGQGQKEATAETVRKLKTEQGSRVASTTQEESSSTTARRTAPGISRPKKDFFKRS